MDNRPVLFLDSGIGGIPYALFFQERNPQESICYAADRENFPYGPRGKEEITAILSALCKKLIIKFNPKIIVLACNTATVSAINPLREIFPQVPFVGTVPAIKPALKAAKYEKIGIIGSERTINDPYNKKLAGSCEIAGIAAPELVEFVEKRMEFADNNEIHEVVQKYVDMFREKKIDTIVLGCTHFLYLINEFQNAACPDIKVFDSLEGIIKCIENLLGDMRCYNNTPENKIVLSGNEEPDELWQKRAQKYKFEICLLDGI
ncbi:MAG: glutamate racemase [Treponema sp.]|jgi:glutamate racemase|nr:glutamate racemase [Treponema sp.]